MRRALAPWLVLAALGGAACTEEGATTAANAAAQATSAPVVAGIDLQDQGDSFVSLTARATDPGNKPLTFRWRVDAGQLMQSQGRAVQWKVPTQAGTYEATLEVSNPDGLAATASQRFTVSSQGRVASQGAIEVQTAAGVRGIGFPIPSPLGAVVPNPPTVAANPDALAPAPGALSPVLVQPVATPAPRPVPTPPPLQPVVLATPTPPPVVLPASPLPSGSPPPPQAGVPVRPEEVWLPYDAAKIPLASNNWYALHFTSTTRGWIAGARGAVMLYDRTGPEEPALQLRSTGIPSWQALYQVDFVSDTVGFVSGLGGVIMRTTDGGQTWQDIGPTANLTEVKAMVASNAQIVTFCDTTGTCYRTEAANDPNAATVKTSWTLLPTRPGARPADWPRQINAGTGFRTDPTLFYFVGDGIYRLDVDADPADRWRRVQQLAAAGTPDATDRPGTKDLGDGAITSVASIGVAEIWAGTQGGHLYRSANANTAAPTFTRLKHYNFRNREDNANGLYHQPLWTITTISPVDTNNVFLAAIGVYDTKDAGATWRRFPTQAPTSLLDLQVNYEVTGGDVRFRGFGVASGGGLWVYK
ncbi:MAG: YCF48-related protein [Candidatus Sericytochromatia bacterium]|nr:YCF48-related protein [Candidatus Sericytochromatia bacterium]